MCMCSVTGTTSGGRNSQVHIRHLFYFYARAGVI